MDQQKEETRGTDVAKYIFDRNFIFDEQFSEFVLNITQWSVNPGEHQYLEKLEEHECVVSFVIDLILFDTFKCWEPCTCLVCQERHAGQEVEEEVAQVISTEILPWNLWESQFKIRVEPLSWAPLHE